MTRILVVEDNRALREAITLTLELRGYEVLQAADGQEALALLHQTAPPPHLLIVDAALPDMNGCELLQQVRADSRWRGVPVVFMTAFNLPNVSRVWHDLGADDFIIKPFLADDLVRLIEKKLRRDE